MSLERRELRFADAIFALLPILYMVNSLVSAIGLGKILLYCFTIYFILCYLAISKRSMNNKLLIPMLIYSIYYIMIELLRERGMITSFMYVVTGPFVLLVCLIGGVYYLNIMRIRRIIEVVSLIAAIVVIMQSICYYFLGRHINVIPLLIMRPDIVDKYSAAFETSISYGLYRPAAFFIEPAYLAQYTIVGFASILFPREGEALIKWKAFIVALGIALCTSGMGLALIVGIFGIRLVISSSGKKIWMKVVSRSLLAISLISIILLFLTQFSVINQSIERIVGMNSGYNAINGRFSKSYQFTSLPVVDMVVGLGESANPKYYMTGAFIAMYKMGIAGLGLLITVLIRASKMTDLFGKIVAVTFLCLLAVANVYDTVYIVFYMILICTSIPVENIITQTKMSGRVIA